MIDHVGQINSETKVLFCAGYLQVLPPLGHTCDAASPEMAIQGRMLTLDTAMGVGSLMLTVPWADPMGRAEHKVQDEDSPGPQTEASPSCESTHMYVKYRAMYRDVDYA